MTTSSAGSRTRRYAVTDGTQTLLTTRAIRRTCQIVREIAAAEDVDALLPDVAAVTAMHESCVRRYIGFPMQQRFIERCLQSDTYRRATTSSLGSNYSQLATYRARPFQERLRNRFGESVNVSVLASDRIVYLDIIESQPAV
jgi:DNA-binding IclR family transcriptional regulator